MKVVDDSARYLLASVSIAGTIVGGLGLVSAGALANVGYGWALPALLCVAGSIAVAAWVLIPVRATISPGRLDLMDKWYADQIKRRGRLIRIAGTLFALSIPLALLPLAAHAIARPAKTLAVSVARDGPEVYSSMRATHLPDGATVTADIASTNPARVFASGLSAVGQDGSAILSLNARSHGPFTIVARALDANGHLLLSRTLDEPKIN